MKNLFLILTLSVLVFSCNKSGNNTSSDHPDSLKKHSDSLAHSENHNGGTHSDHKDKNSKSSKDSSNTPETDTYNEAVDTDPHDFEQVDEECKAKNLDEIKKLLNDDLKAKGITGTCNLGVFVSTHGNVLKHFIYGVSHKKIEFAIEEHIYKLKFVPAKLNGKPEKMWYKMKLEFN